jgi:hypothetical protein
MSHAASRDYQAKKFLKYGDRRDLKASRKSADKRNTAAMKYSKRVTGISKAAEKLSKEETDIQELSKDLIKSYAEKTKDPKNQRYSINDPKGAKRMGNQFKYGVKARTYENKAELLHKNDVAEEAENLDEVSGRSQKQAPKARFKTKGQPTTSKISQPNSQLDAFRKEYLRKTGRKEETEQEGADLQEISKQLAARYLRKAIDKPVRTPKRLEGIFRASDKRHGGAKVMATDKKEELELGDGSLVEISEIDDFALNFLYSKLDEENQALMEKKLTSSSSAFHNILTFAHDVADKSGEEAYNKMVDGEALSREDLAKANDHVGKLMGVDEEESKKKVTEARQAMPLRGHDYHKKSNDALHYISKDAGEAAKAMQGHDSKAESKYLDQVNDAHTVLHYRKKGGKQVAEAYKSDKKKQAWMGKYEDHVKAKDPKSAGKLNWDTAHHHYNTGKSPEEAASLHREETDIQELSHLHTIQVKKKKKTDSHLVNLKVQKEKKH